VLAIVPASGTGLQTMLAGLHPAALALSDDASRLYVALRGTRGIAAIDLNAQQVIARLSLPDIKNDDDYWPVGLAVWPGTSDVLAVSARGTGWPDWRQIILDPGGAMRPQWVGQVSGYALGATIFFSSDGSRLQVANYPSNTGTGSLWSLPAGSAGLQYAPPLSGDVSQGVAVCGGLVYSASGPIYDRQTLAQVGSVSFPETNLWIPWVKAAVACDAARDRVYYWRSYQTSPIHSVAVLDTFAAFTNELLNSQTLPQREGTVTQMVAVGDAGVAFWISTEPFPLTACPRMTSCGL
jgi:hypothetical protein